MCGGVILGLEQVRVAAGLWEPGTAKESPITRPARISTAWNHLEAGILLGLQLPLLIFKEEGVDGGVFDNRVTDVFVHPMPDSKTAGTAGLDEVFLRWQARVRTTYYES